MKTMLSKIKATKVGKPANTVAASAPAAVISTTSAPLPAAETTIVASAGTAPAVEPSTEPKPAPAVVDTIIEPAATPNVETASTNSDSMAWTAVQDAVLIGMKAQGRSWKEIHEAVPGKDIGQLKQRFKDVNVAVKGKGKEVGGGPNGGEGSSNDKQGGSEVKQGDDSNTKGEGDGNMKGGGSGNTQGRKKFEKKKQGKIRAKKDSDDDVFIDPGDFPKTRGKPVDEPEPKKGILRVVEVDTSDEEEEFTSLNGHPVVYMQPEDNLTEVQMEILFELTRKYDAQKWLEVASRFYDRTSKRMAPELLKAMLKNL